VSELAAQALKPPESSFKGGVETVILLYKLIYDGNALNNIHIARHWRKKAKLPLLWSMKRLTTQSLSQWR